MAKELIRNKIPLAVKHGVAWIIYILFSFMLNLLTVPNTTIMSIVAIIAYSLLFILVFYTAFFTLKFFFAERKKYVLGMLIMVVSSITIGYLGFLYIIKFLPTIGLNIAPQNYTITDFVQAAILGYIKFFIYGLLYFFVEQSLKKGETIIKLQEQAFEMEKNNLLLAQEKLQYEYAFLRAQINPHFLHNTLNILYSQALPHSQELSDNIMKLSNIMRYTMESAEFQNGMVSVEKELENLNTLIEINDVRFSSSKCIDFKIEGQMQGQMIPPLSLITVVENAFKYGDLKDPEYPLKIYVKLERDWIYFKCENKKKKNNLNLSSHSIGITNLSKRLDVSFKDKYVINAVNEEDFYIFELTIKS